MNFIHQDFSFDKIIKLGEKKCITDCDIIVPDTNPDIKSILQLDAKSIITDVTLVNEKLSLFGKVIITTLYKPDEDTSSIQHIYNKFDFECTIDNLSITNDTKYNLCYDVCEVNFQLINSRKLRINTVTNIKYALWEEKNISLPVEHDELSNLNCLRKTISTTRLLESKYLSFDYEESACITTGLPDISEILKFDVCPTDLETNIMNSKLIIKCNLNITILYSDVENDSFIFDYQIPFSDTYTLPDNISNETINLSLFTSGLELNVKKDENNKNRSFDVFGKVYAMINVFTKSELNYISDCYLSKCPSTIKSSEAQIAFKELILNTPINMRNTIDFPSGYLPIKKLYDIQKKVLIKSTEINSSKTQIKGSVMLYITYLTTSDEYPLQTFETTLDFEDSIECNESILDFIPKINNFSYSINSSGSIDIRFSIELYTSIYKENDISQINELCESNEKQNTSSIKLYFRDTNENLWDISKKNLIDIDKIENYNFSDDKKIFIPIS